MKHKSGDVAAAKRLLNKIIQIEPNQPGANSNIGAILVASGDLEKTPPFIKANFSAAQHWLNYIDALLGLISSLKPQNCAALGLGFSAA